MAKPPAGSSLLFGVLADSGRIKERKNGSYRMVLKGVDEIDWFTDRPFRSEGLWKPQKLIRKWDAFFKTSDPNAQASLKIGDQRELITFEMFKPKYNKKKQRLAFDIDAAIINERESNLVTELKGKELDDVSLFIDDAIIYGGVKIKSMEDFKRHYRSIYGINRNTPSYPWYAPYTWFQDSDLSGEELQNSQLTGSQFWDVDLTKANLSHSVMPESVFVDSSLDEVNLSHASAPRSTFNRVSLKSADMSNANLSGSVFLEGAVMADISGARIDRTYFAVTNISGASFASSRMDKSTFLLVNASEADFTNANLAGAYFEEVNLTKALFDGADLTDVTWKDVTCPDGTKNIGTSPCTAAQLDVPM